MCTWTEQRQVNDTTNKTTKCTTGFKRFLHLLTGGGPLASGVPGRPAPLSYSK